MKPTTINAVFSAALATRQGLREVNIRLFSRQDISLASAFAIELQAISSLYEKAANNLRAIEEEQTKINAAKGLVLEKATQLLQALNEDSLVIPKLENGTALAGTLKTIDVEITKLAVLKPDAASTALQARAKLNDYKAELSEAETQEAQLSIIQNKIKDECGVIDAYIHQLKLSPQPPADKTALDAAGLQAQAAILQKLVRKNTGANQKTLQNLIAKMQRYLKLREQALQYKGKDLIKTGKTVAESKDARFNSIERVVDMLQILQEREFSAEDYLIGLQLIEREINKISAEKSHYKPLLEEAKQALLEPLSAVAEARAAQGKPELKQKLDAVLVQQLKVNIQTSLLRYSKKRQRSMLYAIPDKIFSDNLHQRTYAATSIASALSGCYSSADYFRLLVKLSEKIDEISNDESELKKLLISARKNILTQIILPGKMQDGLSEITFNALKASGFFAELETEPVLTGKGQLQARAANSQLTDYNKEMKSIFVQLMNLAMKDKKVEARLEQLPKLKHSLQKLIASFYSCQSSDDYLRHYNLVVNVLAEVQAVTQPDEFNAVKNLLVVQKSEIFNEILLVGKVNDGLLPTVLGKLAAYDEAKLIVEKMPELTPMQGTAVNDYLAYLQKLIEQIAVLTEYCKIASGRQAAGNNDKQNIKKARDALIKRFEFIVVDILLNGSVKDPLFAAMEENLKDSLKELKAKNFTLSFAKITDAQSALPLLQVTEEATPDFKKPRYEAATQNEASSALKDFENVCSNELSAKFAAHKVLSSGLIAHKRSSLGTVFNITESLLAAAVSFCGLPSAPFVEVVRTVGMAAQEGEDADKLATSRKISAIKIDPALKKQAEELFSNFYASLAQKIIEKYPYQILQLKHLNGDMQAFNTVASSLVDNIIRNYDGISPALTSDELAMYRGQTDVLEKLWLDRFAEKLMLGVENDAWISGSLVKHADDKASSLLGQAWNTNSLFSRAGLVVKTEIGCIFYHGHGVDAAKYGYRFATLEEVDRLNLKPDEQANKNALLEEQYSTLHQGDWFKYEQAVFKIKQIEPLREKIEAKQQQLKQKLGDCIKTTEKGIQELLGKIAKLQNHIAKFANSVKAELTDVAMSKIYNQFSQPKTGN